jgi:hypothetical protein
VTKEDPEPNREMRDGNHRLRGFRRSASVQEVSRSDFSKFKMFVGYIRDVMKLYTKKSPIIAIERQGG